MWEARSIKPSRRPSDSLAGCETSASFVDQHSPIKHFISYYRVARYAYFDNKCVFGAFKENTLPKYATYNFEFLSSEISRQALSHETEPKTDRSKLSFRRLEDIFVRLQNYIFGANQFREKDHCGDPAITLSPLHIQEERKTQTFGKVPSISAANT